jgi:DNA-3-methyladenine glycosylase
MPAPLPRSFYARATLTVARDLLGRVLARRTSGGLVLRGRIVEAEAYVGEGDKACHARAGRTPRTDVMYGPPGFAYVYLTYGMHHMLNVVTEAEGRPAAVLLRAVEPLEGLEWMARARRNGGGAGARGGEPRPHELASGPGKLCQSFGLDLRDNRADLLGSELWIEEGARVAHARIATSARIGCETAAAPWDLMPWRFYLADSRFVTPGRASAPLRKSG